MFVDVPIWLPRGDTDGHCTGSDQIRTSSIRISGSLSRIKLRPDLMLGDDSGELEKKAMSIFYKIGAYIYVNISKIHQFCSTI